MVPMIDFAMVKNAVTRRAAVSIRRKLEVLAATHSVSAINV